MEIIKGHSAVIDTVAHSLPTNEEIKEKFPHYTSGYVSAHWVQSKNAWLFSYVETRNEAIQHYTQTKQFCEMFPESFGDWSEYGDYVVFATQSRFNPKWSARFAIVG